MTQLEKFDRTLERHGNRLRTIAVRDFQVKTRPVLDWFQDNRRVMLYPYSLAEKKCA
jgi:hypothetical protein